MKLKIIACFNSLVLKELTGCRSYTIVGDANQRLIKVEEEPAMLKLKIFIWWIC